MQTAAAAVDEAGKFREWNMNLLAAVDLLVAAHRRGEPGPEEAWTAVERFAHTDNPLRRLVQSQEAYRFEHEPPHPRAKTPATETAIETAPLPGPQRAPTPDRAKAAGTTQVQPITAEPE